VEKLHASLRELCRIQLQVFIRKKKNLQINIETGECILRERRAPARQSNVLELAREALTTDERYIG